MNITLRKASALQREIKAWIANNPKVAKIEINEYDLEPAQTLEKSNQKYFAAIQQEADLLNLYYAIRSQVANLNVASGISQLLNELELNKQLLHIYNNVATTMPHMTLNEINLRLEKIRGLEKESRRYSESEISTSCISEENILDAKKQAKELRSKIRDINDQLLTLNTSSTIALDEKYIPLLSEIGLL